MINLHWTQAYPTMLLASAMVDANNQEFVRYDACVLMLILNLMKLLISVGLSQACPKNALDRWELNGTRHSYETKTIW